MMDIGNKIKTKRLALGIKQETLAHELDISQTTLSRIENGKEDIGINKLQLAAQVLKTPINYFTSEPINITQENTSFENSNGVYIAQSSNNNELLENYKELMKQKDLVIEALAKENTLLAEKIQRRDRKIEELKKYAV